MKLRLVLKVKNKKGKESVIKFNIAPSKHIGFIRFMDYALKNDFDVSLSFEKISSSGKREDSKIGGTFKLGGRAKDLEETREEAEEAKRKQKKKK